MEAEPLTGRSEGSHVSFSDTPPSARGFSEVHDWPLPGSDGSFPESPRPRPASAAPARASSLQRLLSAGRPPPEPSAPRPGRR